MEPVVSALEYEAELLQPKRALSLLRETCAGSDWEIESLVSLATIKRWPGRRLTVRCVVEARDATGRCGRRVLYGKLFRGRRGERSHRVLRALYAGNGDGLALPEPLGYLARRRFLLMTELAGESLDSLRDSPAATAACMRAGRALARFHALSGGEDGDWLRHGAAAEAAVLGGAQRRMAAAPLPEALRQAHATACAGVLAALEAAPGRARALLHRDLYPAQVLVSETAVGFVDLDEVALGEPELDLGNFLAHLQLTDLQAPGNARKADAHAAAIRQGYAEAGQIDASRLGTYQAAALLRLASLERLARPECSQLAWDALAAALIGAAGFAAQR